jgi:hypothetical protein
MQTASLQPPASYDSAILVYGLFGIISLVQSDYLILITSRKRVSKVLGAEIYAARDFKVFPLDTSLPAGAIKTASAIHRPNETFLLSLIKGHLYSGPFYYTYGGYDVTSRMQVQDINSSKPLWERVRPFMCPQPALFADRSLPWCRQTTVSSGTSTYRLD